MDDNDYPYVFISHKCKDHEAVFAIVNELEARGVRCWIDERDILAGEDWYNTLRIKRHGAAAVVWVQSLLSSTSVEVLKELKQAQRHSQLIIPLEIEPISEWSPEWDDFSFLQAFRVSDPRWADRLTTRILGLGSAPVSGAPAPAVAPAVANLSPVKVANDFAPLVIVVNEARTYQLDGLNGLGESLISDGDSFATSDLGQITVSADAAVIATNTGGRIELWALGAAESTQGPVFATEMLAKKGLHRMLAVDQPLGQAIRVIAAGSGSAYSVMQRLDGRWAAMKLIDADDEIVSGAVVKDDLLFVFSSGATAWASNRSKRPFSLQHVRGVDAAVGIDGRNYVAAWGTGSDGVSLVEVVVEGEVGWDRVHRGPGVRAGIVRVMPDIVRQRAGASATSVAVQSSDGIISIVPLP